MNQAVVFFVLSVLVSQISSSVPKSDRVKEEKPLSDHDHFSGGEHDTGYDHDAFLGHEQAKKFSDLSPEESKEKLGKIVDKIDVDQDGFVTEKELKEWIDHQQKRYIYDDAERQWKNHNVNGDKIMTWAEYNATTFSGMPESELVKTKENAIMNFPKAIQKDKRRWVAADVDQDTNLDYEEYVAFVHPEERLHMHDVVVTEAMEDMDKDQNGQLSEDEYIAELYKPEEGADKSEEPEWVQTERKSFMSHRDKNADGHMDRQEVKDWLLPTEYDHVEAEAKHLIYESDKNKDKNLSKEEILDQWATFVPSRALLAERDEL